ncbi:hypothetical protein [Novosphingobium soli]|uniref:Homogentisate 1,2-dioxygenase n=1 Tax=Novosphingobium soli TaxID=574956 RepID=A0ABV6CQ12_9SPHN
MPKPVLPSCLLGVVALLAGAPIVAQAPMPPMPPTDAAPDCAAPATLPPPLAAWTRPVPMAAVGKAGALRRAVLQPDQAVTLALMPTPKVSYPVRPEKPGGSVSYGGLARFAVTQAGTWRVALGSGAWIDVVKDGRASVSVAHGHGPECSGIRKMVDYDLSPGTYALQVAANGSHSIRLLVTRLP